MSYNSKSQQVDSSRNQNQATDQNNDAIGLQALKDNPLPGLPTPAQSPEPQLTIPINQELRFKLVLEKKSLPKAGDLRSYR